MHVSTAIFISTDALEKFIVQGSLQFGPFVGRFLNFLFSIIRKSPIIMYLWWGSQKEDKDKSLSTWMELTASF